MRSLELARKKRKKQAYMSSVDVVLTQADVSPEDRKKLSGILKWMMESPHPFEKCHKALLAHGWSEDRAKKTCAVLKDVATGTTKWRNQNHSKIAAEMKQVAADLSEFSDEEAIALFSDCDCEEEIELADTSNSAYDTILNKLLKKGFKRKQAEALARQAAKKAKKANMSDSIEFLESVIADMDEEDVESPVILSFLGSDEVIAVTGKGVAKFTSPEEGKLVMLAQGTTWELDTPEDGKLREVYDELRPTLDLADDQELMVEFISDFKGVELANEDPEGLVWKTILRTGRWALGPWSSKDKNVPMKIVPSGPSDPKNCIISLEEIKKSFDSGAKDHVTVPLTKEDDSKTHTNRSIDNTGFVRKLKIVKGENGQAELKAGIHFTDPEVKSKAIQGSLANVSGGIKYQYQRKRDGKVFPSILDHVAITNDPWLDGMEPFGLSESEDSDQLEVVVAHLARDMKKPYGDVTYADPGYQSDGKKRYPLDSEAHCRAAWSYINMPKNASKYTADQLSKIKARIKSALKTYGVEVSASQATTEGGDDVAEGTETVTLDAEGFAKELGFDSVDALKDRLALAEDSAEELHKRDIRDTLRDWEEKGVPPAVIAAARPFLDGDDGGPALNLSEDGNEVQLSVSEIVKRVVESVPTIDLSEHSPGAAHLANRPEDDSAKELSPDEKADRVQAFLDGKELDLSVHEKEGDS